MSLLQLKPWALWDYFSVYVQYDSNGSTHMIITGYGFLYIASDGWKYHASRFQAGVALVNFNEVLLNEVVIEISIQLSGNKWSLFIFLYNGRHSSIIGRSSKEYLGTPPLIVGEVMPLRQQSHGIALTAVKSVRTCRDLSFLRVNHHFVRPLCELVNYDQRKYPNRWTQ